MIRKENVTRKYLKFLHRCFYNSLFCMASGLDVFFDEQEIKYIKTKMMTHELYRVINNCWIMKGDSKNKIIYEYIGLWLDGFLDDPDIPAGVIQFAEVIAAHVLREYILLYVKNKDKEGEQKQEAYQQKLAHEFLAKRWMETCR